MPVEGNKEIKKRGETMVENIRSSLLSSYDNCVGKISKELNEVEKFKSRIKENIMQYNPADYADRSRSSISTFFDHTYLKPDCTYEIVDKLSGECIEYNCKAICIPPTFVGYAKTRNRDLQVATVIGFPLGYTFDKTKQQETSLALSFGADEIDMVQNVSMLKNEQYAYVYQEIASIKRACKDKILKVILETSFLTLEEKIISCIIAYCAGADFVKTSTGFSDKGATLEDIILMKMIFLDRSVKASGGIKTLDFVKELISHGVDRIGCSSSIAIIKEYES